MRPLSPLLRFFLPGILLGAAGGAMAFSQLRAALPLFAADAASSSSAPVFVRCANEVKTEGWTTYRNGEYGIVLQYPDTYALAEGKTSITLTPLTPDSTHGTIELEKKRGSVQAEMAHFMNEGGAIQQGGWKVTDRQAYVLTTPYYSDDGRQNLWSNYFFVRDFPLQGGNGRYIIIKATITKPLASEELRQARAADILDPESIMTVPEQILSTLRFQPYDELYRKSS